MDMHSILSLAAVAAAFPFLGIAIVCGFSRDKDKKKSRAHKEDSQPAKEPSLDED